MRWVLKNEEKFAEAQEAREQSQGGVVSLGGGLDKRRGSFLSDPKASESKATLTPLEPQGLKAAVPGHSGQSVIQTHRPGSPQSGGHT